MNNTRNVRFYGGFATAIILVLLVGASSYYTLKKQVDQEVWVDHTYTVINQVNHIGQLLVDMETGRRGFRCTGDKLFLEPYYKSQPKMAPALDDLGKLISDNPVQVARVSTLTSHIDSIDSLWKNINVNTVYANDSEKKEVTLAEKVRMDRIRADIQEITGAENGFLLIREQESKQSITQAIWTLIIGVALVLLVVFFLIRLILSEFKTRVAAQRVLKDKVIETEKINTEIQETNWLLTGTREINGSLIGHDSLAALLQSCLVKTTEYLKVPVGAFYFYDPEKKDLQLMGSVALPKDTNKVLQLNEGITGYAASQKEITVIRDIPANYWKVESASGGAKPDAIICVPLWQKRQLKGVMELACFSKDITRYTDLLKEVADNIAIAVNGAYSNSLMVTLLQRVQEQKEELESQQEELRQTNEELSHQAEVLRASEEELKTQEEELKQINAELEEKTETVELARMSLFEKAKELEASSKYKSEFLANMSHELRTPLNSVLILANLLKENKAKNLTEKQTEYAKIIHRSGSDLLNLINDILDLSKIEAGKIDMVFEEVKIKDVAYDMEQLFSVLASEKKIKFSIVIQQVVDRIQTDKQRLEQVIKNLLSNAFKFTPEQGEVKLTFTMENGLLKIAVSDTGIGIATEKQQLIFEAFQQADGSTSRKFGGTGLGLSISKELVRRLNGEIRISSKENEGSTFTLLLPQDGSELAAITSSTYQNDPIPTYNLDNVKEQSIIEDDKQQLMPGQQSILIIEDDTNFARIVTDFAHSKGYKAIVAITGDEGLYCAKKYKPVAIILDLGLPVIDGRSVLRILKSDNDLKGIPVHVISSEDRGNISSLDIEAYFQKPLQPSDLDAAFSNIDSYIQDHYKNILILCPPDAGMRNMYQALIGNNRPGLSYDMAGTFKEAKEMLAQKHYDCIIADIGSDVPRGVVMLQELKTVAADNAYIITCLDVDIEASEEKQIKKYSESIIRRSTQATPRLLDEVELFLHKIKNTPKVKVPEAFNKEFDKSLGNKKVLLADDDMRNVFALTAMLEEQGMNVIAAENGREALEMLAQNDDVDIVLMDIMMPEMDGYETMRRIRAERRYGKLPVIALTAKAMTGDREKCLEAGASDYITKPVDSNKLFSLMRVWLS